MQLQQQVGNLAEDLAAFEHEPRVSHRRQVEPVLHAAFEPQIVVAGGQYAFFRTDEIERENRVFRTHVPDFERREDDRFVFGQPQSDPYRSVVDAVEPTSVGQDHRDIAVRGDVAPPQLERTADTVQPLVLVESDPLFDGREPRGPSPGEDRTQDIVFRKSVDTRTELDRIVAVGDGQLA